MIKITISKLALSTLLLAGITLGSPAEAATTDNINKVNKVNKVNAQITQKLTQQSNTMFDKHLSSINKATTQGLSKQIFKKIDL